MAQHYRIREDQRETAVRLASRALRVANGLSTARPGNVFIPNVGEDGMRDGTGTWVGAGAVGNGGVSPWVGDTTPPGVPTGVTSASAGGALMVEWDVTLDGGVPPDFAYVRVVAECDGEEASIGELATAGSVSTSRYSAGDVVTVRAYAYDSARDPLTGELSPNASPPTADMVVTIVADDASAVAAELEDFKAEAEVTYATKSEVDEETGAIRETLEAEYSKTGQDASYVTSTEQYRSADEIMAAVSQNYVNNETGSTLATKTEVQQTATELDTRITAVEGEAGELATLVRQYGGGVLVGRVGNMTAALVNADGSFDIVAVAWDGGEPSVGSTLARFDDDEVSLAMSGSDARVSMVGDTGLIESYPGGNGIALLAKALSGQTTAVHLGLYDTVGGDVVPHDTGVTVMEGGASSSVRVNAQVLDVEGNVDLNGNEIEFNSGCPVKVTANPSASQRVCTWITGSDGKRYGLVSALTNLGLWSSGDSKWVWLLKNLGPNLNRATGTWTPKNSSSASGVMRYLKFGVTNGVATFFANFRVASTTSSYVTVIPTAMEAVMRQYPPALGSAIFQCIDSKGNPWALSCNVDEDRYYLWNTSGGAQAGADVAASFTYVVDAG